VKIALVSPYDSAYPGGVFLHISYLERYFTKMGHEVKVIAPASKAVSSLGDRFIPIGKPRPVPASGSICRVTISPWLSSKIKAVLDKENFDIIHLHEPLMPMLCTTVLRLSQTANIGTFHACHASFLGIPAYNYARPAGRWILRKWFRKLDGKIAVSKAAMEFVRGYLPGYYNIIPNGVDLDHFSPDVAPIDKFCDGKLNILFVGRLEKRKGLNFLLEAFKQVKQEIPDSRLIIVGPGTRLRRKYEKQVVRSSLKDVIFAGFVSYDELPRYYKTADVFCAPATSKESFGIILLEAMAMGKPIVASNIGGYAGVVTHGVEGLLVPPRDVGMLAQALISLLTDPSLRQEIGAKGRAKALEYSWEQIAQRVLNYYMRVLSEPPWRKQFPEFKATTISV
jgi:phosphatidylinositol alpha-mannosyltransferase